MRKRPRNDGPWRRECIAARGENCRVCGVRPVQLDHIWPRAQGGPSVVENGCPMCPVHHAERTANRLQYRYDWLDPDQIAWLAEVGYVAWDDAGEPYGRGYKHFERRSAVLDR